MAIVNMYPTTLTSKEKYDLLKSPTIHNMQEAAGQVLEIKAFIIHEDVKGEEAEIVNVMNISTTDGNIYATNSATFIREFLDLLECATPEELHRIEVVRRTSKNGRPYLMPRWID